MKRVISLVAFVLVCFLWRSGSADESAKTAQIGSLNIATIGNLSEKERLRLIREALIPERRSLAKSLISQLESPRSAHHQASVAYLLGLYRMESAIEPLAKVITLDIGEQEDEMRLLGARHPALEAIVAIGYAAVPVMIRKIETSEDIETRRFSAEAIRHIFEEPQLAQCAIEIAIKKQSDPRKKKNLEAALQQLREKSVIPFTTFAF